MRNIRTNSRYRLVFSLLAVVCALFLSRSCLFSSEEAEIRALLARVQQLSSFTSSEHPIERISRSKDLVEHADYLVRARKGEETWTFSREQLLQKVLALRSSVKSLETSFELESIEVQGTTATIVVKASALGEMPGADGQFFDQHRVRLSLKKSEDKWILLSGLYLENLRGDPDEEAAGSLEDRRL